MSARLMGGKTPPRLLLDLSRYNPQKLPISGYNVLTESAYQFEEGKTQQKITGKGVCSHKWILKGNQSLIPAVNATPDGGSVYTAAACCSECRCHLELVMNFIAEGHILASCPSEDIPLHHFVWKNSVPTGLRKNDEDLNPSAWIDEQHFICSVETCATRLTTKVKSPRLTSDWAAQLSSKDLIRNRVHDAKAKETERARVEGVEDRLLPHGVPSAFSIQSDLRSYITNPTNRPEPRFIPHHNKKWLLCFGDRCLELVKYAGFGRVEGGWQPPAFNAEDSVPYSTPKNRMLDDIVTELTILMANQPLEEQRAHKTLIKLPSADTALQKVLGCNGYKTSLASRTIDLSEAADEHPFYAGIGTVVDFHDDLLAFGYDRQVTVDAENAPYYLECLQGIAKGRRSEDLDTKVAIEASSGKVSVADIRQAYRSFGLVLESPYLDDDTVIGMFKSRLTDAPKQEAELRRALSMIGQHRKSAKIRDIASNTVTTYEQALFWLGAHAEMDAEFLTSMYEVKVGEHPEHEDIARTCISLIAEARNNEALRHWLREGYLGPVEMDSHQGYARLGIENKSIDDDLVIDAYNVAIMEAPSQIPSLKEALKAVAKSRDSSYIFNYLQGGSLTMTPGSADWPVGLENIGNTCYLNSLLQFYFTVTPLRDLILNFDDYKMEANEQALSKKQVGSRKVSSKEILRAQRFAYELQKLFYSMITAVEAQVTPETELARLTLMSSSLEENYRRQSLLGAQRPALEDIQELTLDGSLSFIKVNDTDAAAPPQDFLMSEEESALDGGNDTSDHDSEGTLVNDPLAKNVADDFMIIDTEPTQPETIMEDKENLAPAKATLDPIPTEDPPLITLEDVPSSTINEQHEKPRDSSIIGDTTESPAESSTTPAQSAEGTLQGPPNYPPPIPPRQPREDDKKAVELGAQQDVTEVIANVLFQLQCAITPESIDDTGEQIDQIKRLFFGKQKTSTTNDQGATRTKEEYFTDIKVDVASGPRDIYGVLDGAFDVQEVEVGGKLEPQFTTISQLPPIMQILVQRVQFDQEKKTPFKSIHHLELRDTIYMDRYMDSSDEEIVQRRQDCWQWKKSLSRLQDRKRELDTTALDMNMVEVLNHAVGYLEQISTCEAVLTVDVDSTLIAALEAEASIIEAEMSSLDQAIKDMTTKIGSQFSDLRSLPYRLHSVFIHRGAVNSGHYWIYIYDFSLAIWRKYNDGYVTEVKNVEEIFEQEDSPRPATPYFLVYVKDELKDVIVNAVVREVGMKSEPAPEDVEMVEAEQSGASEELTQWARGIDGKELPEHAGIDW